MQSRSSSNYKGIDISHWDGTIDFDKVKYDGVKIVYIKATQGESYVDPHFVINAINAKKSGLLTGYYHYFTAISEEGAINEAIHFVETIKDYPWDCRLAIDIEEVNNLDGYTLSNLCRIFLEKVQSLTKSDVVIYTYASFITSHLKSYLNVYPLWIAEYGVKSPRSNKIWNNWIGFQYSNNGHISGVSSSVDLDEFTKEILLVPEVKDRTHANPSDKHISNNKDIHNDSDTDTNKDVDKPKNKSKEKTKSRNKDISKSKDKNKDKNKDTDKHNDKTCIKYKVKPGDNLTYIAERFHTTVSSIVKINHIKNPNIIYIGQVLKICKYDYTTHDETEKIIKYRVRPGDTLSYLAEKFNTTVEHIVELNHIRNPNIIYVGQILKI